MNQTAGSPRSLSTLLMLVVIFLAIYFIYILPRRRLKRGKVSGPLQRLRIAYLLIFIAGGSNVFFGMNIVLFLNREFPGISTLVFGICFVILGYFVRQKSTLALGIAVGIFIFYLIGIPMINKMPLWSYMYGEKTVLIIFQVMGAIGILGLFIFFPLYRGFGAIHELKHGENSKKSMESRL